MEEIKVQVGQVWTDGEVKYKISKVTCEYAYYIHPIIGLDVVFGDLTYDGYPSQWDDSWYLAEEAKETIMTTKSVKEHKDLYSFFASVREDECACGLLREQCSYHR